MPSTTSNTSPATSAAAANPHPDIPPFPSPSTFSILPDIWLLIARLNILHQQQQQSQAQTNGHNGVHPYPQQSQQQPSSQQGGQQPTSQPSQVLHQQPHQPPSAGPGPSTVVSAGPTTAPILNGAALLDPKDLPAQIYPLKQRLATAREAVSALPDVDRTVAEQDDEIRMLQGVVRGLKGRLVHLARIAAAQGNGGLSQEREREGDVDVEMEDDKKEEEEEEAEEQEEEDG
ncbi:uncharacterized protein Z519_09632 [Cladophialophora bantiana CBS 173.52]|uniref:Mediator of RNA polymerase II transcription subunit 9 n=1 Tax=Cladophialophora bantiana (strain ATCC 10958 / CBS 173.52 / CDC B-1940 / NIH 8579) TaxID=1442370 RepID=A0A0D2EHF6_CLAB1|nr:uncharacterized protein Z519_09632 [Cladophialophora bantiana CBS 173.52]KIW89476.1 hypothetical protein Z519_09632 [Cladophialophora bantiana CBS 173.52]